MKLSPTFAKRLLPVTYAYLVVLFMFNTIVPLAVSLEGQESTKGADIINYLTGAEILIAGEGENIFDLNTQTYFQREVTKPLINSKILPFRSLPVVALLFVPLALLTTDQAYSILLLINLLLIVVNTALLGLIFPKIKAYKLWFLIPISFFPVFFTIILGQILILVFMAVAAAYYKLQLGKDFWAGALSGLILIRPHFILLLIAFYMLSIKRSRFLFGILLSIVFLLLMSIRVSGPGVLLKYPAFLASSETEGLGSVPRLMYSFQATAYALFGNDGFSLYTKMSPSLYLVALALLITICRKVARATLLASACLATIAISPHSFPQDSTILLIPIFIFLQSFFENKNVKSLLMGLSLLVLPALFFSTDVSFLMPIFLIGITILNVFTDAEIKRTWCQR